MNEDQDGRFAQGIVDVAHLCVGRDPEIWHLVKILDAEVTWATDFADYFAEGFLGSKLVRFSDRVICKVNETIILTGDSHAEYSTLVKSYPLKGALLAFRYSLARKPYYDVDTDSGTQRALISNPEIEARRRESRARFADLSIRAGPGTLFDLDLYLYVERTPDNKFIVEQIPEAKLFTPRALTRRKLSEHHMDELQSVSEVPSAQYLLSAALQAGDGLQCLVLMCASLEMILGAGKPCRERLYETLGSPEIEADLENIILARNYGLHREKFLAHYNEARDRLLKIIGVALSERHARQILVEDYKVLFASRWRLDEQS